MLKGMKSPEPERPAESWKYPYVAGVVDMGSSLTVNVAKDDNTRVGYIIGHKVEITSTDPTVLGFIDEFCDEHGIQPLLKEDDKTYRLTINRRDDLELFFRLVQPYLLQRHEQTEILLNDLLPGLNEGKPSTEGGFYEMMEHVEAIRELGNTRTRKYDREYFAEEWNM